jgi:hypothetical protein
MQTAAGAIATVPPGYLIPYEQVRQPLTSPAAAGGATSDGVLPCPAAQLELGGLGDALGGGVSGVVVPAK